MRYSHHLSQCVSCGDVNVHVTNLSDPYRSSRPDRCHSCGRIVTRIACYNSANPRMLSERLVSRTQLVQEPFSVGNLVRPPMNALLHLKDGRTVSLPRDDKIDYFLFGGWPG